MHWVTEWKLGLNHFPLNIFYRPVSRMHLHKDNKETIFNDDNFFIYTDSLDGLTASPALSLPSWSDKEESSSSSLEFSSPSPVKQTSQVHK